MNFMSYVAEVSRGWDEPNARDMGRMTSQPDAKGEMYILNDGIDMKAKFAAMERRLEKLEMTNMQPVQAISQTPLQAMPCAICLSYEHLVDECPTIPAEREMFGDCNTYNSNWRDHPNFSWKPQPPQYKQPAQAPQQASSLEQAMVNLSKVVGDFVGAQKSINAHLNNLQDSISRFANLNTMQEKENSPSQPYQNSKAIHVVEAQEEESSMVKEVKMVITLSGKEVDLPTCKLEHKVESETEKEKREEIKGKKKRKSIENDGYDVNVQREPQMIVIKEELMKKHIPFLQALRNCKEIERKSFGAKTGQNRAKTGVCEISQPLRNRHFAAKPVRSLRPLSAKIFAAAKPSLAHECHFAAQEPPFRSCETAAKLQNVKILNFAAKAPFRREFRNCKTIFGTRVPFRSTVNLISQLRNGCEIQKKKKKQSLCSEKKKISQPKPHFAGCFAAAKPPFGTRMPFRSPIHSFRGCEITFELRNGCEIISKRRNDLQIAKLTCEIEEGLQKHLAKPREVAKMPSEPRDHASDEESPAHLEITHTKPLTPFLTS
ncbi:hypothetical protein CK203_058251 [Vitis vinifera]|uniref:Uncharacterized protein n=1 Tax=Vitis vinifera TaxID=29760 RepID=A0A438FTQ6_VITVI|nr:hypothetical protein CK203_058251 [Vitis vinifera]